jgi:hypothetical protein
MLREKCKLYAIERGCVTIGILTIHLAFKD